MATKVETLAKNLDDFAFDFDFYSYQDAVEDRSEHITSLVRDLETGNVAGLLEYLDEVMQSEGDTTYGREAFELHKKVREYYAPPIPVDWIDNYLDHWCNKPELEKFKNFTQEMVEAWRIKNRGTWRKENG